MDTGGLINGGNGFYKTEKCFFGCEHVLSLILYRQGICGDLRILILGYYQAVILDITKQLREYAKVTTVDDPLILRYGFIWEWDVSKIVNLSCLFWKKNLSPSISNWNVSNAKNMAEMFYENTIFNEPLDGWDVSNVEFMDGMFLGAKSFNQPLEKWNVGRVKNMDSMFNSAKQFDQPLEKWNVSHVATMKGMFKGAESFNQPIGKWNVSSVQNMSSMFSCAISFNQPLTNWDLSKVTTLEATVHRLGPDKPPHKLREFYRQNR
jgi:surface protein